MCVSVVKRHKCNPSLLDVRYDTRVQQEKRRRFAQKQQQQIDEKQWKQQNGVPKQTDDDAPDQQQHGASVCPVDGPHQSVHRSR